MEKDGGGEGGAPHSAGLALSNLSGLLTAAMPVLVEKRAAKDAGERR
ncbi:hypothetical protein AB0D10_46105 [Kitasatospora sp. NPDC048545]